ncbi:DUF2267 domain-containing protein [Nitratiruptor tergarcus]|uniref:Uncharacterized conserved protein, DUF2267 family n=1 Tax=Nitratiruptor tergarcus DSM 16512 TaxID=1069081 RepID=A0A1W1WRE6_9BACT|nr:DUF2267 domain-containing protein [Nitratiruptor tergarcus]SMC08888.1 Uncharacterized conserved protein, DUF2267 family [Nitratiruptor tergarcus DSM 16512]
MRFEKDVQKAREFLKELAQTLGIEDSERAERILRAVLRVIRRRIAPQEYLDFIAQLPICIKAEAINGWKMSEFPDKSIKRVEDFVAAVKEEDNRAAQHDFGDMDEATELVRKTFAFLKRHISEGEMKDLIADLPEHLKTFVEEA